MNTKYDQECMTHIMYETFTISVRYVSAQTVLLLQRVEVDDWYRPGLVRPSGPLGRSWNLAADPVTLDDGASHIQLATVKAAHSRVHGRNDLAGRDLATHV